MLVVSVLLAFNALLLWVATGPRSLAAITPYMEDALSASDGSYDVKIGETRLIWDGWRHPVAIRLQDVKARTGAGQELAVFSEIALDVDVFYLPLGRIMPTSLTISSPMINIIQNEDHSFDFEFKQAENKEDDTAPSSAPTVSFPVLLARLLSQSEESNFRSLRTIIIRDAAISVSNGSKSGKIGQLAFFNAEDFDLVLKRDRYGEIKINSNANIQYKADIGSKDYSSSLRTEFSFKPNKKNIDGHATIDGTIEFSELMPDILAGLFSGNPDMKSFAVPINGRVNLSVDMDGVVQYLGFDINGGRGSIVSERLAAPLPVSSLQLQGAMGSNFDEMKLELLAVDMDGIKLSASGTAKFFDTALEADATPEIAAYISLKDVHGDKMSMLWPPALSPVTREWVTSNMSGGKITEARLALNIMKGDLSKKILPKEAVDANIDIDDFKIFYLPDHPPVTHVKGKIHIDGLGLAADIVSADYLEKTKLSNGHVLIDDLNADNPYIKVDLHADAPARDMVHFLGLPRLEHVGHLGLRENAVSGNVKGEAKVGFNFFAPMGMKAEDAITYEVKADVEGISQKDFLHKFDIAGANGSVSVNNSGVEFSGSGEVNGANVRKGNVKYLFKPEKGIDTFLDFSATAGMDSIKRFGYPDFPFMKGSIGVNAKVKLGNNLEQAEATLDLAEAEINLKEISWKKTRGEAATLELITEKKDGTLKINSFNLSGKKISATGSAALTDNFSDISAVQLNGFTLGNSNISSLVYIKNTSGMLLEITGGSVDVSGAMESDDGFSFKDFPALQLKADIGKIILGKDREIANFSGELLCDKTICQRANLQGKTGTAKPFAIKIFKDGKGQRRFSATSDDAGSFLRSLGVFDGMNDGKLTVNGNYKESDSGSYLAGKLNITEHTVKDAPLLGKVLSLASLTGFFDALAGNGIRFRELTIPFTLHNDVVTLEKGKTFGAALGLTVDGTITFPQKILDLHGTVVPSYTLNNVLGGVPIFGDMLIGGEGQGMFAARYSIKGLEKNADVRVNPLSILTPGFLRGLFDIFDEKQPEANSKKQ